jgi:hypothetical protein
MFGIEQTMDGAAASMAARSFRWHDALTLDSWITRIAAANTDDDVVALAREFLDSLPGEFLPGLGGSCRPPEMRAAQDVSSYAFVLMNRCIAKDTDAGLLAMSRFFAAASQRLSIMLMPRGHFTPRPQRDFG